MEDAMDHLEDKLVLALFRSYRVVADETARNIRSFGLSVTEFGVLEALFHKGPLPVQALSHTVLVTSGSMTYITGQLEKKELVSRQRCDKDKRIWYIALTDKGRALMARIYPLHQAFLARLFQNLSSREKRDLILSLGRLRRLTGPRG